MHGVAACVLRDKGRRRWRVFKAKAVNGLAETDSVKVQECTHPQAHRLTHASADAFYREHILYREHMCRPQIDTCVRRIPVALATERKRAFRCESICAFSITTLCFERARTDTNSLSHPSRLGISWVRRLGQANSYRAPRLLREHTL
jgi:hypothetical protein